MTEKSKMTEEELEEILKLISNLSRKEWLFLRQAVNAYFDKKAKEIELDSNFVDELVNEGHNLEDVIKDITDLGRKSNFFWMNNQLKVDERVKENQ